MSEEEFGLSISFEFLCVAGSLAFQNPIFDIGSRLMTCPCQEGIILKDARYLVPRGRVELPLSCENRILSPARLPVPPSGRTAYRRAAVRLSSMPPAEGQSASPLFFEQTGLIECTGG